MESTAASGSETPFEALRELVRGLERTSSRLEKRRLIAHLLRSLGPQEVAPAVLMLVAGIFPESEAKVLNVGQATARSGLEMASARPDNAVPLTILEVHRRFNEIAAISGRDSVQQRRALLAEL